LNIDPTKVMKVSQAQHKVMSHILNILNHYKYCFLRNTSSTDSKFIFEKPIKINTSKIQWNDILANSYEIARVDQSLAEIFEEENFDKESLLTDLKSFYKSLFGKEILDPEVHYFHNSNPLKEQMLQTEDIVTGGARILSYDLLNSGAKLITNYKT